MDPTSSSSSLWALPAAVVSIEAVEQRLKPYVAALKTMVDPNLFPRWIPTTVSKCFSWADGIHALAVQLDAIQTASVAARVTALGIAYIDDDPSVVLTQPHATVLRALLRTPLLPMSTESAALVRCAYDESVRRLGAASVRAIFEAEHARIVDGKRVAGHILAEWSALVDDDDDDDDDPDPANEGTGGGGGGSGGGDDDGGGGHERVRPDEVYLAAQLVLACGRSVTAGDADIGADVAAKVQKSVETDGTRSSLRTLCLALSLSPAAVWCAADTATASPDTHVTIDAVAVVLRSPQLWAILVHVAQTDIAAFQCLADVFSVFEALCRKNASFNVAATQALADAASAS